MSDLLDEKLLSLAQAAELCFAASGRRTHRATLRRWALHGCGGVKLEVIYVGRFPMTSREACARFMRRRAEVMQSRHGRPVATQPARVTIDFATHRRRQFASAMLDSLGI